MAIQQRLDRLTKIYLQGLDVDKCFHKSHLNANVALAFAIYKGSAHQEWQKQIGH